MPSGRRVSRQALDAEGRLRARPCPMPVDDSRTSRGNYAKLSRGKLSQGTGVRRFDVVAVFGSLWLLASMVIDAVTPKELTVYMIGAAIAPATAILAILYWLKAPWLDFAVIFATLWMV